MKIRNQLRALFILCSFFHLNTSANSVPLFNFANISYSPFHKAQTITEDLDQLDFTYGPDDERKKTVLQNNSVLQSTRYFSGNYEETTDASGTTKVHYINCAGGLAVIFVIPPSGAGALYYPYTDHLGSILKAVDETGATVAEQSFDAWGRERNPNDWTYTANTTPVSPVWLIRGFTGHERHAEFGLINMNGRMYDPIIARMLSPDIYMQTFQGTQALNKYAYANNNPLRFTDPDGNNPVLIAVVVGAAMGAYTGGTMANQGELNPVQWDFSSGKTWGYMAGGALIGGVAGYGGATVAGSGMAFSNTLGIVTSSFVNSWGMSVMTGGQTDFTIGFGVGSMNFSSGELGFLGKPGNSTAENIGYAFGALANIQDAYAGSNGTDIEVKARPKLAGHSEFEGTTANGDPILVSVGPSVDLPSAKGGLAWEMEYVKLSLKGKPALGENVSYIDASDPKVTSHLTNVNGKKLAAITERLNKGRNFSDKGPLIYGLNRGCVNYTSRALFAAGVWNVNALLPVTAPLLLNFELGLRQIGIFASPHLITYGK